MNYLPHQQRVVDERTELDAKIEKLSAFIVGEIFKRLSEDEQSRMVRQKSAMSEYSDVLSDRIAAFTE